MKFLYIMVVAAFCLTGCAREYHVTVNQTNYPSPRSYCFEKADETGKWNAIPCSHVAQLFNMNEDQRIKGSGNIVIIDVKADVPKDIKTDAKGELSIPASIIP